MFAKCLKLLNKSFFVFTYTILLAALSAFIYMMTTAFQCIIDHLKFQGTINPQAQDSKLEVNGQLSGEIDQCAMPLIASSAILIPAGYLLYFLSYSCRNCLKPHQKNRQVPSSRELYDPSSSESEEEERKSDDEQPLSPRKIGNEEGAFYLGAPVTAKKYYS